MRIAGAGPPDVGARVTRFAAQAGIGFAPIIQASMRLGEGTGAVCLIPLLDSALSLYNGSTFADIAIEAYDPDLVK